MRYVVRSCYPSLAQIYITPAFIANGGHFLDFLPPQPNSQNFTFHADDVAASDSNDSFGQPRKIKRVRIYILSFFINLEL